MVDRILDIILRGHICAQTHDRLRVDIDISSWFPRIVTLGVPFRPRLLWSPSISNSSHLSYRAVWIRRVETDDIPWLEEADIVSISEGVCQCDDQGHCSFILLIISPRRRSRSSKLKPEWRIRVMWRSCVPLYYTTVNWEGGWFYLFTARAFNSSEGRDSLVDCSEYCVDLVWGSF